MLLRGRQLGSSCGVVCDWKIAGLGGSFVRAASQTSVFPPACGSWSAADFAGRRRSSLRHGVNSPVLQLPCRPPRSHLLMSFLTNCSFVFKL